MEASKLASSMRRQESRDAHVAATTTTTIINLLFLWTGGLAVLLIAASGADAAAATAGGPGAEAQSQSRQSYFGTFIGNLAAAPAGGRSSPGGLHGVSGEVYAVDEQTLFIRNFNYDGLAPDAYFWSSVIQATPTWADGFIVPDEKGSTKPLERYVNKDVVLRLPEGKTLREIHWLSVWSRAQRVSVGDILIPHSSSTLLIPRPLETAPLSQLAHGLRSGPITIVDAQTLLVPDFHYDGLGPDAYFWLTRGTAGLSSANSLKLRDENGNSAPLRKYTGETIVISLPDEFTIYDFDFFGVWCRQFAANFGQVALPPRAEARVPPSPKMLGIKPENKLNCEILYDDLGFELRWVLDGDDIVMQLVGKIEPGEYMAFGLGKDDSRSDMNGADAVVAWVDRPTGQVHATDYYLGSKAQCVNEPLAGSCPDTKLANGSDSLTLLHGAIVNGYSMVTFKRPQLGVDEQYDQHVYSDGQQSVIWAVGVLNKLNEIGYHRLRTKTNMFIDFARNPQWNCPIPDLNASMHNTPTASGSSSSSSSGLPITSASQVDQTVVSAVAGGGSRAQGGGGVPVAPLSLEPPAEPSTAEVDNTQQQQQQPWFIPQVVCPQDRTFHAQIGPTAGRRGYAGLTGRSSWVPPVSWYINGLLVPELVVERGQAYRFIVEGGNDKTSASRRHPLYLTDSPEGGFNFKTDDERLRERILGGVAMRASDGQFVPTAEGRLCEWKPTNATLADPDLYPTFSAYQRSLKLDCLPGQASILKFVPDAQTPDHLYYQCYTNRFMGWRVRVVNSCQAYIGAQLAALKQQQRQQQQVAASNQNHARRDLGSRASTHTARARDTLNRRQSSASPAMVDLIDLKGQASEQRMLAFESPPPPPGLGASGGGPHSPHNHETLDELNLLQSAGGSSADWSGGDFGDDFAASEEFQQTPSSEPLLLLNNSTLLRTGDQHRGNNLNMSSLEQILRLSPSDLEFLDEPQLDLASAMALAASSNQQLDGSGGGGPVPIPLQNYLASQQQQQQKLQALQMLTGAQNATAKANGTKTPKSLHAYMRRLASMYYPVQQQLASMLSLQSATQLADKQRQQQQQQQQLQQHLQQQMLASLHQQIVAASAATAVPPTVNKANLQSAGEQATAASAPSSSFSLASLMPKSSKIDLSKSNLSKKLSKLRIKSGRKYEPQQASASNQQVKQQPRPPTPDNEFNYDIFNSQLAQLEKQQRQFQSMESFAAAMAAANNNHMHWPQQQQQQQQQHQQHQQQQSESSFNYMPVMGQAPATPTPSSDPEQSLMFATASPFEQQQQQQRHHHHHQNQHPQQHQQQDPLQQQQQTLNFDILKNFRPPPHNQQQQIQRPPVDQSQQAVFVTKLPQQTLDMATGQPLESQAGDAWPAAQRYPYESAQQQQQQQTRPNPSYLDSTDYQTQRQHAAASVDNNESRNPTTGGESDRQKATAELLSGSDGTNHYLIRHQTQGEGGQTPGGDSGGMDHMLAIERYSKQSSERRPPSIVHPVTGEQVYEQLERPAAAPQQNHSHPQAPRRFSSKLIDNHIVEPSTPSTPPAEPDSTLSTLTVFSTLSSPMVEQHPRGRHQVIQAEILDAEQSAQGADLKRIVTPPTNSEQQQATTMVTAIDELLAVRAREQQQQQQVGGTTEVPPVLLRPSGTTPATGSNFMDDHFRSQPPPTMAMTTPPSMTSLTTPASGQFQAPSTTSSYAPGPLVPSMGPPTQHSSQSSGAGEPLIFKSNLIEPIKSTLVPTAAGYRPPLAGQPSQFNLDFSPFTPIEISSSPFGGSAPPGSFLAPAASTLLATRLRPPPFIESMLSSWAEGQATRPEPPVRVASYLAQQLAQSGAPGTSTNNNNNHLQRAQSTTGLIELHTPTIGNQQQQQQHNGSSQHNYAPSSSSRADLIILKPAVLSSGGGGGGGPSQQRTFGLRPQYLTTTAATEQSPELGGLFYSNSLAASDHESASGRLAGHQFDRLSSLSSPPSTSTMIRTTPPLDPMQEAAAANSEVAASSREQVVAGAAGARLGNYNNNNTFAQAAARQNNATTDKEQQQDEPHAKQKLLPTAKPTADSQRGEFNILARDNSTDNAILTHVMSLIASHAVPTPPLIPLASAYSSADYFLPISDQVSLQPAASHFLHHNHLQHSALLRARSLRT